MSKESVNNYYLDTFDLSSLFGEDRGSKTHRGVDFNLSGDKDLGMKVLSIADGVISKVSYQAGGAGNYIVVDHSDGTQSKYMHLQELPSLKPGEKVTAGQNIGKIGNTGHSSGAHLHLEVLKDGKHVDPVAWLKGKILGEVEGTSPSGGGGGMFDVKGITEDLIDRGKTFSWVFIPLVIGLLLLLYTLYSMFIGGAGKIIKRTVKA